jgi:hypothetical protein
VRGFFFQTKGTTVQFANRWKSKFRLTDDEIDEIEREQSARRARVELAFQACRALVEAGDNTEAHRLASAALGRER